MSGRSFLVTSDDADGIRFALSKDPYGVISDRPDLAKELRGR